MPFALLPIGEVGCRVLQLYDSVGIGIDLVNDKFRHGDYSAKDGSGERLNKERQFLPASAMLPMLKRWMRLEY